MVIIKVVITLLGLPDSDQKKKQWGGAAHHLQWVGGILISASQYSSLTSSSFSTSSSSLTSSSSSLASSSLSGWINQLVHRHDHSTRPEWSLPPIVKIRDGKQWMCWQKLRPMCKQPLCFNFLYTVRSHPVTFSLLLWLRETILMIGALRIGWQAIKR